MDTEDTACVCVHACVHACTCLHVTLCGCTSEIVSVYLLTTNLTDHFDLPEETTSPQ